MLAARTTTRTTSTLSPTRQLLRLQRRLFQSVGEFQTWRRDISDARLQVSALEPLVLKQSAPFLHSVSPMADHLQLSGVGSTTTGCSPVDSLLQCRFPLSTDDLLRNSVTDFSNWSSFRLGKFYESVDALTADVAYRHVVPQQQQKQQQQPEEGVTLVTAGHYHSRKFHRTDIHRDMVLRSYVTSVGTSSLELRTDALQQSATDGQEDVLVNVCHTIMVALDTTTMKPLSKVGRSIPPLVLHDDADTHDKDAHQQRLALAQQHADIRKERQAHAMQLRAPVSAPPTLEEMQHIHKCHQRQTLQAEQPAADRARRSIPPKVADFTFRSSTVIFPEQRNVHGKLFGGAVMEEAQRLAQYTATFFAQGNPLLSFGIDEAIFLQPIAIGDLVTFTARVVHSTARTARVLVTVEVRDPADRDRVPLRSNRLMFVFGGKHFPPHSIVPERYGEILMHMDALRRHTVEGPFQDEVDAIWEESAKLGTAVP